MAILSVIATSGYGIFPISFLSLPALVLEPIVCKFLGGTRWKREERALKGVVVKLTCALFKRSSRTFQRRATIFRRIPPILCFSVIQKGERRSPTPCDILSRGRFGAVIRWKPTPYPTLGGLESSEMPFPPPSTRNNGYVDPLILNRVP